jgi:hypothetical protein
MRGTHVVPQVVLAGAGRLPSGGTAHRGDLLVDGTSASGGVVAAPYAHQEPDAEQETQATECGW